MTRTYPSTSPRRQPTVRDRFWFIVVISLASVLVLGLLLAIDVRRFFAHPPTAAQVAGTWEFDAEAFSALVELMDAAPANAADGAVIAQRNAFRNLGREWGGYVLTFTDTTCGIGRAGDPEMTVPCRYVSSPSDRLEAISDSPEQRLHIEVICDPQHEDRLLWLVRPGQTLPMRRR